MRFALLLRLKWLCNNSQLARDTWNEQSILQLEHYACVSIIYVCMCAAYVEDNIKTSRL